MKIGEQLFAGTGLGILVGLLIGLSSSPVVATVVTALAAGMITLLGFNTKPDDPQNRTFLRASAWRLGSFGMACGIFVLVGLYVRANDVLSPSPKQEILRLSNAGFSPEEARRWVLVKHLGASPGQPEAAKGTGVGSSVLFAGEGADDCRALDPANYQNAREQIAYLESRRGTFAAFGRGLSDLSDSEKSTVLSHTKRLFCPE
jgi:hypothetical protein